MDTNNYNAQDNADLTPGLQSGSAHVVPSASIMKGGLAGLSILEMAALGVGGFIIYKNRERIFSFLESYGFDRDALLEKGRSLLKLDRAELLEEDLEEAVEETRSRSSRGASSRSSRSRNKTGRSSSSRASR